MTNTTYNIAGHEVSVQTELDKEGRLQSRITFDGNQSGIRLGVFEGVSESAVEHIITESGIDGLVNKFVSAHLARLEYEFAKLEA